VRESGTHHERVKAPAIRIIGRDNLRFISLANYETGDFRTDTVRPLVFYGLVDIMRHRRYLAEEIVDGINVQGERYGHYGFSAPHYKAGIKRGWPVHAVRAGNTYQRSAGFFRKVLDILF
jgi:hypothetical protein